MASLELHIEGDDGERLRVAVLDNGDSADLSSAFDDIVADWKDMTGIDAEELDV